ncbi:Putative short chain dehydrogenase/reductase [Mycobacteroides abscessus]|nr:Putative short chain dehydrogenase/reductase [Mycobacteroides abscessus]
MVKSLAAQSISKNSPTGSADSTFTTGIRDGLHQQGVEVVLLDDFVPHRPAMDAGQLTTGTGPACACGVQIPVSPYPN